MEQQQIDMNKLSIAELKVIAYDTIEQIELHSANLNAIRQRIADLQKAEQEQKEAKAPSKS